MLNKSRSKNLTVDVQTPYEILSMLSVSERLQLLSSAKGRTYLESLTPTEYAMLFPSYFRKEQQTYMRGGGTPGTEASGGAQAGAGAATADRTPTPRTSTGPSSQPPGTPEQGRPKPQPSPGFEPSVQKKLDDLVKKYGQQQAPQAPPDGKVRTGPIDRSRFDAELKDPELRKRFAQMIQAEVGHQTEQSMRNFTETVFNRATYEKKTLKQLLSEEKYFQPYRNGRFNTAGEELKNEKILRRNLDIIDHVQRGSNDTKGASHNFQASSITNERLIREYDADPNSIIREGGEISYRKRFKHEDVKNLPLFREETSPGTTQQTRPADENAPRAAFQPGIEKQAERLNPATRAALERFRLASPNFQISSAFRGADHPIEREKPRGPGAHSRGEAIDVSTRGKSEEELRVMVQNLKKAGFNFILLEGNPPHIHAEVRRNLNDTVVQNLGAGHPSISLKSAREAISQVEYNSLARTEQPQEASQKVELDYSKYDFWPQLPDAFKQKFAELSKEKQKSYLDAISKATPEEREDFLNELRTASTQTQRKEAEAAGERGSVPVTPEITAPPAPGEAPIPVQPDNVKDKSASGLHYPVEGRHDIKGNSSWFGASRPNKIHEGIDIYKKDEQGRIQVGASAKVIAPEDLTIEEVRLDRTFDTTNTGNYVIARGKSGQRFMFMHLGNNTLINPETKEPYKKGEKVSGGQGFATIGGSGTRFAGIVKNIMDKEGLSYEEALQKANKDLNKTKNPEFTPGHLHLAQLDPSGGYQFIQPNIPEYDRNAAQKGQQFNVPKPVVTPDRIPRAPTPIPTTQPQAAPTAQPTAQPTAPTAPTASAAPTATPAAPTASAASTTPVLIQPQQEVRGSPKNPIPVPASEAPPAETPKEYSGPQSLYSGGEVDSSIMPNREITEGEKLQTRGDTTPIFSDGEHIANYNPQNELLYFDERSGKSVVEPKNRINYDQLYGKDIERIQQSENYIDQEMINNAIDTVYNKISNEIPNMPTTNPNLQNQMNMIAASTNTMPDSMIRYIERRMFKERGDAAKGNYYNMGQNIRTS